MDGPNNGIVLYHYSFSPYARRVIWYLALRGIDYAQCVRGTLHLRSVDGIPALTNHNQVQPPVLPRPDVKALGISYRRIPLMSIGRDVYCDTRIILRKLEELFPKGAIGASQPEHEALQKLLEAWTIDGGIFNRASQLIPASMPLLNDPKFTKDRQDFSGRSWEKSKIEANRPEALAHIRNAFNLLETTLLSDDREWILKTEKPSLGDIEGP
jgi:glutathione S-transferase